MSQQGRIKRPKRQQERVKTGMKKNKIELKE